MFETLVYNLCSLCYNISIRIERGECLQIQDKLSILTESAKYDVACTSSGATRSNQKKGLGNAVAAGICHSFSGDGRCISLLKVLQSNVCRYNCAYCVNRSSNDLPRATFTPEELAELTIGFYRRNYIEGLFLSSGVVKNPDYTMELMIKTLELLRVEHRFGGYIHAKTIPGASSELVHRLGLLADRISVNLELPSEISLNQLAPDKPKQNILLPMAQIRNGIQENTTDLVRYQNAPTFAPAGQSTQMIIGATPDSDYQIVRLAQGLYRKYGLKRVFYSAYIPMGDSKLIPLDSTPQSDRLGREHRLYQADWLLRFYGFAAEELLSEDSPFLDPNLDPKCQWAIRNLHYFPVEVNTADLEMLLRIPGVGPKTARKILTARRAGRLDFEDLKKLRVVLKRAAYFITCKGKSYPGVLMNPQQIYWNLVADTKRSGGILSPEEPPEQFSLFAPSPQLKLQQKEVFF